MSFRNEVHWVWWNLVEAVKVGDWDRVLLALSLLPGALFRHLQAGVIEVAARHFEVAGMLLTGDLMTLLDQNRHHEIIELFGMMFFLGAILFRLLLFLLPPVFRILARRQ